MFIGCKKDNTSSNQTININEEYERFMFKGDTYWVYSNNLSNEFDSLVLSYSEHSYYWNPPPVHGASGTQREYYKMTIESKSQKYEYNDVIDSYGIRRNPETQWYICGVIYYSITALNNFERLDSLTVNGKVFRNVLKCNVIAGNYAQGCSNSGFIYNTDLYTVPDYGIIRKVVYDPQSTITWDLIRWNIIK
jgi:hypothetical protein